MTLSCTGLRVKGSASRRSGKDVALDAGPVRLGVGNGVPKDFANVVILATNSLFFKGGNQPPLGTVVESGDVIANNESPGPTLEKNFEIGIDKNSKIVPGGTFIVGRLNTEIIAKVVANRLRLKTDAVIGGNAFFNEINIGSGGTIGGDELPIPGLPFFPTLPDFRSGTPSSDPADDVVLGNGATELGLVAGNYRDLVMGKDATVVFTGGIYSFRSISTLNNVKLHFSAPSEVRVAEKVFVDKNSFVGPDPSSVSCPAASVCVSASRIIFFVEGINGSQGGLTQKPPAVEFGNMTVLEANVYAPNGRILLKDNVDATGAFVASDVQTTVRVKIRLNSFFNEAPEPVDDSASVLEGGTVTVLDPSGTSVLANDDDPNKDDTLTVTTTAVSGPTHASVFALNSDGTFSYTHDGTENFDDVFTYEVCDDGNPVKCSPADVTIDITPVNDPSTLDAILDPTAILEDAGEQTVNLSGITQGGDGAGGNETLPSLQFPLTVTATSSNTGLIDPTVSYSSPNTIGTLSYTPVTDQSGSALITVTVKDSGGTADFGVDTFQRTFTVEVTAVNDAPTLDPISNPPAILEGAGQQIINLSGITQGGGNETLPSPQFPLTVTATSSNTGLIDPTVSYSLPNTIGTLSYTPVTDQSGSALITVTVKDSGGTADFGVDTFQRTFTVEVTAVNDTPTLDPISNPPAILEGAGQQIINLSGITQGGGNETLPSPQFPLTVTATSSNTGLIDPTVSYSSPSATGSLSYTPVADQSGSALITVTVKDSGGIADFGVDTFQRTFTVEVTAVNDAPTLDPISNPPAILEGAGQQIINLSGITQGGGNETLPSPQFPLTVTATSSNTGLIDPTVSYSSPSATGSLSYTPVADQSGSALITVTVKDSGGIADFGVDTFQRTFTVVVTPVNDAPTLDAIGNAVINEDVETQNVNLTGISAGGGETQFLTVTATSDNSTLIPNPVVTYTSPSATGSLSYTPVADQNSSAEITVTVMDDGGTPNGGDDTFQQAFTVTVLSVPDAPRAGDDGPFKLDEGGNISGNVLANDVEPDGQPLVITSTGTSGPSFGGLSLDALTGAFTYTHDGGESSGDGFTYEVCDNEGPPQCDTADVTFTITPVNDDPVALPEAVLTEGTPPLVITLTGTDPENEILTFSLDPDPTQGTLDMLMQVPPSSATVRYTATLTGDLPDSFGFRVTDPSGLFDETVVDINALDPAEDAAFTGFVVAKDIPGGFEPDLEGEQQPGTLEIELEQAVVITLVAFADVEDPDCEAIPVEPLCVPVGDFAFSIFTQPAAGTGTVTNPVPSEPTAEDLTPPLSEELFASVRTATVNFTAPASAGTTTFVYQACVDLSVPRDGDTVDTGECDEGTVTIDFAASGTNPLPGAPTAENMKVATEENTPVEINLAGESSEGSDDPCDSPSPPAACDDVGERSLASARTEHAASALGDAMPLSIHENGYTGGYHGFGTFPITVDAGWFSTTDTPPAFFWPGGTPPTDVDETFTFTTTGAACVSVTDDFLKGDQFEVFDDTGAGAVLIGTTSSVTIGGGTEIGPDAAFVDPTFSSGSFAVGAGSHSITILAVVNPFAGGGRGYIRVDSEVCPVPGKDLIVLGLDHDPEEPNSATTIDFTTVVKNIGTETAGASTLCFEIGGENCDLQSDDTLFDVPILGSSETFEVQRSQQKQVTVDTNFQNTAVADFDGDVAESNEGNNTTIDNYIVTVAVDGVFATITLLPTAGTLFVIDQTGTSPPTEIIATGAITGTTVSYVPNAGNILGDSFAYSLTNSGTGAFSDPATVDISILDVGLFCEDGRLAGTPPAGLSGSPFGLTGVSCTLDSQCCSGVCFASVCQ